MAKKQQKAPTNLLAGSFGNSLSVVIGDKNARKAVETQLKSNHIDYVVEDLPKMESGKVVGCEKQITIKDKEKFFKVIGKTNSFK